MLVSGVVLNELDSSDETNQVEFSKLIKLINYIDADEFWKAQIAQVKILENGEAILLPQVTKQYIEFGSLNNIEDKFERLRIFYTEILPRKGWDINGHVDIGSKNIKSDTLFESNENSSDVNIQSMILASIGKYFPVKKRSTIHTQFSGGHITNSNLLWNELYRLGGLQSIRGFNENFFYASSYAFVNIEYRLFFDNDMRFLEQF